MANEEYISGYAGEEISLLVEGIKIMALQNCSYKESQDKEPIYGAGFVKAHAMGRGKRKFELDFEVKELNQSVVEEPTNAPRSKTMQLKVVKINGTEYASLLDIKNATVLIVYPAKNGIQKIKKFTGFEFTDVEEGFAFDDSAVGKKCSGLAIWGEGMV
ncbi:MAG: hypothetical protein KJZ87_02410 [Thermoguttaceae bacterium]|nr:hypothetical protein [Thermoguttaceae bacterium]